MRTPSRAIVTVTSAMLLAFSLGALVYGLIEGNAVAVIGGFGVAYALVRLSDLDLDARGVLLVRFVAPATIIGFTLLLAALRAQWVLGFIAGALILAGQAFNLMRSTESLHDG
jgi:hypothetical protein